MYILPFVSFACLPSASHSGRAETSAFDDLLTSRHLREINHSLIVSIVDMSISESD